MLPKQRVGPEVILTCNYQIPEVIASSSILAGEEVTISYRQHTDEVVVTDPWLKPHFFDLGGSET